MATAHSIEPSKESNEALTPTVCSIIPQEVLPNHGKSKTTEPTQGEQTTAESNVAKVCDLMNEGDTVGPTTSVSSQNALGCHPDRNLNVLEKDNVTVAGAVSVEDKSGAGDCVNDPVKISACGRDSPRIETGQTWKDEIAEPMDCVDDSTGVGISTCTKLEKDETLTVLGSQIDAKGQLEQLESPLNPQSVRSLAEQEPARTDVPESCEISEKTKLTLSVGNVAKTEEDLSTALVGGADTESVSQISPSAETCSVRSELSESVTESLNSAVDNTCSAETVTVPGEMSGQNSVSQSSSQISTIDAMEIKEEETKTQEPGPASRYDHLDTGDYNEEGVPIEFEEPEFVWEEYLEETGSAAVPPTAFKHVECSLQSGFIKGMKLEVPNKDDSSMFWVASVVMTCGPLLRLRYEGYEDDSSADFWCDLSTSEVHTIGWCAQNNKTLQPPEGIKGKYSDWGAFLVRALTGARTAPSYLLDKNTGTTPVDQIKRGMRLELQNAANPLHTWIVRVIENVGGRLYLRYEGADSGNMDFWLFYLDYKVHPAGWTKTKAGHSYYPPAELRESKGSTWVWSSVLDAALREAQEMVLPPDVLKDQVEIVAHRFQAGYKLEALHPVHRNQVCPATVTAVLSSQYFTVTIDSLVPDDKPVSISCHARSSGIYPIGWCMGNGIKLTHPKGWSRPDFTWNEYLAYCRACAAPDTWFNLIVPPHEFERGLKLEAVNPTSPNQVCAATITKISDRLLWLHLDSNVKVVASHIEDIESHNLFPVGWCESNDYMLKPPRKGSNRPGKRVAVVQPERSEKPSAQLTEMFEGNSWCPKIYFNHRCFSGPYLSKGRIAELPKCVGPGPIQLVMKEVLSMLINVAYKSCRVLREIQMEGEPNLNMHQQVLKAKYKTKSYRAVVEICKSLDQLEEFCRQICIKLECCPNLISANFVGDHCPETCSQLTKTKYTYYYGKKKKKVGRPPGGHTNLENGAKKPGKRKKRKKITLTRKPHHHVTREESIPDDDAASVISESSESKSNDGSYVPGVESDAKLSPGRRKRKYTHHIPVPSAITTRGAKLPKFSFERKTHKKILCNSTGLPSKGSKSHHKHSPVKSQGEDRLRLHSNPLSWSIGQVVEFIKTTDCSHLARLFREHEIDGQALLLLTLPTVQEHMELKLGPAIKLCHHIERVKIAFYDTYAK